MARFLPCEVPPRWERAYSLKAALSLGQLSPRHRLRCHLNKPVRIRDGHPARELASPAYAEPTHRRHPETLCTYRGRSPAGVSRRCAAPVRLADGDYISAVLFENTGSSVGGTVINNDDLLAIASLRASTIDRPCNGRSAIVSRNDGRDSDHQVGPALGATMVSRRCWPSTAVPGVEGVQPSIEARKRD